MDIEELKFSKMKYETAEAKALFTKHQQFLGLNYEDTDELIEDSVGNKIRVSGLPKSCNLRKVRDAADKLGRLSQLIQENEQLFCQLEHAIRNIPPDELKALDLKLIAQNLVYCASRTDLDTYEDTTSQPIVVRDGSPLVSLALVAQQALTERVHIVSERQTAVVCWLFADLCKKAGFEADEIALGFTKEPGVSLFDMKELDGGCFCVVTAKSDLDSAVDVLVETPDRTPWRVKRVLVQESVLREFRTSLEDKARRNSGAKVDEVLLRQATGGCRYKEKTFLFDFVGGEAQVNKYCGTILVEAYRTVKELLALLNNHQPYALSVWSDSVAESHEISHHAPSSVIWVNSYGNFDGPPQASQSFFSSIEASRKGQFRYIPVDTVEPKNLLAVWKCWSSLSTPERAAKLKRLKKYNNLITDESFYRASDKFVCAGAGDEKPSFIHIMSSKTSDTDRYTSRTLTFVVHGGCVLLRASEEYPESIANLVDALRSVGAPVGRTANVQEESISNSFTAVKTFTSKKKVVWTSYGTIFSN